MESQMVDFYTINNKIYLVIKELELNNNTYVFLANEMDSSDDMVRRVSGDNLLPIDTDEEFFDVMKKMFS